MNQINEIRNFFTARVNEAIWIGEKKSLVTETSDVMNSIYPRKKAFLKSIKRAFRSINTLTGSSIIIPKKTYKMSKITRRSSSEKNNVISIRKTRDRKAASRKSIEG